ncbi:MAG: hypothetical protein IJR63_04530 [Synergistaceae bacterium]|nr:hypothetical protein [Synergistaceae bacterium]
MRKIAVMVLLSMLFVSALQGVSFAIVSDYAEGDQDAVTVEAIKQTGSGVPTGVAAGAAGGAAIGSFIPVVGTAVGAGIGAVVGGIAGWIWGPAD